MSAFDVMSGEVPVKEIVMEIENRNTNIPVMPIENTAKTPMKSAKPTAALKGMETPRSQTKIKPGSASCTKVGKISAPSTPLSPSSVNTCGSMAREAARAAKLQSTVERINKVAELRNKWAKEKESKTQLNAQRRTAEIKRLHNESNAAAEKRKKNIELQKAFAEKQKQEKKEMLADSLATRNQLAIDLQIQAKAKRRISVFLNRQMMKKALAKEQQLIAEKKQHEVDLLATRRLDFLETRHAKEEDERRKRESMIGRGRAYHEQKVAAAEIQNKLNKEEAERMEARRQNWIDEKNAKLADEQRKRESLAFRLDHWHQEKVQAQEEHIAEKNAAVQMMTSRAEDWKDVQQYKESQSKRDRQSLADRLNHWRQIKKVESDEKQKELDAAVVEAELQQQAMEDVRLYREGLKHSARQSLAQRLDKARQDKSVEEAQKAAAATVASEEARIAAEDRMDVNNYRQKLQDSRRQSLEHRNQFESRERVRLANEKQQQLENEAIDRELSEAAWRDVKAYQEKQREEARKSLAWRIAEAARQHDMDLTAHSDLLRTMHDDFELKHMDWQNVQEYKSQQQERKRMSMALRGESWRMQRMAEEKLRARKEMEAEEDARLREQDREALLAAKAEMASTLRTEFTHTSMLL